ncbi:MAG: tetratricopeptide repeat protein [Acidobacteria bacterium]|nr:tetratricopeptide repeat protein [Acidobacteriota bacterium]
MHRRLFLLIYVLSGAAALLYEVLWLRLLTLLMGHTTAASGTLLAAFMGGLAIGSWQAGRIAASVSPARALRAYASIEIAIAACALLLPGVLSTARPLLEWAYANGEAGRLFDATLGLLALLLLSVPAAAMGATYPLAVRAYALEPSIAAGPLRGTRPTYGGRVPRSGPGDPGGSPAARAGGLYAFNTAGAAAGAALTGFVLLPMVGAQATTLVGVALNAICALGALALAKDANSQRPTPVGVGRWGVGSSTAVSPQRRLRLASVAIGISGLAALVYQVTWTRILALVLGPTTYAFSAMLVAFITGLAIGSLLAAAMLPRLRRPSVWLGGSMIAAAGAALVACLAVDRLPLVMAEVVSRPEVAFSSVLALQVALVVAIQLPMTIALGAALPLAIALAAPTADEMPRDVAIVYASNTLGAIVGALAGSFILIPAIGVQTSIRVAAGLAVATGVAVCWPSVSGRAGRVGVALAGTAAAVLALVMPSWNHDRIANGGYRYAPALAAGDIETGLDAGRLVYYREGAAGIVSVREVPGVRSLAIDGKVDASSAGDMLTQKLLAHLPLLLHPNPRRVCVIGLGSGVTLGAALQHPIDEVDVVEISPEVVAASAFFAKENHDALADGRTRLILGDGRSHLLLSDERYDVIISEPSNPWMAGVAALFTREFFLAARERLAPGGLLTQWAHTYNITDADLRSIVATFLSVFPDGTAWLVGESDLLLIGGDGPVAALDEDLAASWGRPGVAADLAEVSVRDPFSVLSLYVARGADLRTYAGGAVVQSDDKLALEYSAPRAIYGRFQRANVDRLRNVAARAEQPPAVVRARDRATAVEWRNRGLMQLQADAPDLAYQDLQRAIAAAPRDVEALHGFARAASGAGRFGEAETLLAGVAGMSGSADALVELSIVRAALGRVDEATDTARQAVLVEPGNRAALEQLASMYADRGDEDGLDRLTQIVGRLGAGQSTSLYCQARLAYLRGDFALATERGEQRAALDGTDARVLNLLGSAYAALGRYDRAREALERSLRLTPRDPGVLVNLGTVALRSADPVTAADRFSEALFLSPTLPAALNGLAEALEGQGKRARAVSIRGRIPGR